MSAQPDTAPLRPWRIPVRAAATALGAFALLAPFTDPWGLGFAVLSAPVGVAVGEGLAYSRLATPLALAPSALTLLLAVSVSQVVLGTATFSAWLGPPGALTLSSVLGFGLGTLALVAVLRTLARRAPAAQVVEILAFGLAATSAFAAHRDGAVARPLWLADRAWRMGLDPASVLLAIGAVAAVAIGMLQLLETRHRLPWLSWLWLPVLALAGFLLADVTTSEPPTASDLEAIQGELDRPPEATGSDKGGERSGQGGNGSEGGQQDLGAAGEGRNNPAGAGGEDPASGAAGEPRSDGPRGPGSEQATTGGSPAQGGAASERDETGRDPSTGRGQGGRGEAGGADQRGQGTDGGPGQGGSSASGDSKPQPDAGDGVTDAGGEPPPGGASRTSEADSRGSGAADPGQATGSRDPSAGNSSEGSQSPPPDSRPPADSQGAQDESAGESSGANPPREQPDVEDQGSGSASNSPVAVVILGDDYSPLAGYYYLRQGAASEFAGTRLVPAERSDVDEDVPTRFPSTAITVEGAPLPDGRALVHGKVAILAEHDAPFALEGVAELRPAFNPNPARFMRAWEFTSHPPLAAYETLVGHTSGTRLSDAQRAHYLAYPEEDPRYRDLANRLIGTLPPQLAGDPFARALAIKQHLDQMAYDTSERHAGAPDPTAEFLFEGDQMVGYCVHAAHASVYLLRSVGIPARVATGYAVQEERRRGSSLVVMGKDAHAWPELYLDDVGWLILDISPAENRDPPGEPLDEEMADLLSDMAREEPEAEASTRIDWRALWHGTLRSLRSAAIAFVAIVLVLHYCTKLWRRARPYAASRRVLPRVAYRAVLDRLAEAGLVRRDGETRERFARRMASVTPSFVELTELHLAATLGHPDASEPRATHRWLRMLTRVHREVSSGTGWRRWLGVMNPFSFYRSR